MQLTKEQLDFYEEQGYLFITEGFPQAEIEALNAEIPKILAENSKRRVVEKDGHMIRSVYGSHLHNEIFNILSRHPRIVLPAMRVLESDVYVYQFKINAKASFGGDLWEWHQDFTFWQREDGMPAPRALNAVIFLDEVNEFNGPLYLIPGSHAEGAIDSLADDKPLASEVEPTYESSPGWINNLTANLKYALTNEVVGRLVAKYGLVAPKGRAGSILFFHSNLVHGSSNNISPFDRKTVIISFNSVQNLPVTTALPRPEFIVGRDAKPIVPVAENALLAPAQFFARN
ncbi:MAG TPA: phytanoyl-CoA dioxygenase family protein [Pyrinomonadaceae bacterium]|nr:phytanoyl-CoA dioxygenase family protein [Pyrinomonadaceae bacterium]